MNTIQVARFSIALVWVYHGLVPKLLHVAPVEKMMTASFGLSEPLSLVITRVAGALEISFGLMFYVFYKNRFINYLSIAGLAALLLFTCIFTPSLLVQAFNPVTTNIPVIVLGLILLQQLDAQNRESVHG